MSRRGRSVHLSQVGLGAVIHLSIRVLQLFKFLSPTLSTWASLQGSRRTKYEYLRAGLMSADKNKKMEVQVPTDVTASHHLPKSGLPSGYRSQAF
jgi:hypothetical protein